MVVNTCVIFYIMYRFLRLTFSNMLFLWFEMMDTSHSYGSHKKSSLSYFQNAYEIDGSPTAIISSNGIFNCYSCHCQEKVRAVYRFNRGWECGDFGRYSKNEQYGTSRRGNKIYLKDKGAASAGQEMHLVKMDERVSAV